MSRPNLSHDRDSLTDSLRALAGLIDAGIIPAGQIEKLTVHVDARLDVNQALAARIALDGSMSHPDSGNYADRAGLTDVVRTWGTVDSVRVMLQIPATDLGHEVPVTTNVVALDERVRKVIR